MNKMMIPMLLIVGGAAVLMLTAQGWLPRLGMQLHEVSFIDRIAQYQIFAFGLALAVAGLTLWLNPASKVLLRTGDLSVVAVKESWLGINGHSSWRANATSLLLIISLATAIFMGLALKQGGHLSNFQWSFLPLILLFSLSNSLSEELIFRFGVAGTLLHHAPKLLILLLSAALFGLPHYAGWPNGPVGVLMAGVLGYVLGKATLETTGLGIAWVIHFVQDVIIFTALFMMNVKS